ncbi:MAG: RsmE family RNA methyltransferase, partial [Luminiphilus sp.]|nr:RsmE family RNA methyltransferase [Luminiphilus sp.]
PKLSPPSTLLHWVGAVSADEKWALDGASGQQKLPETAPKTLALLVGPEGGLTDSEISAAQQSGFRSLRLGPRVLRTETAPVVALTLVNSRWGDIKHS